MSRPPLRRLLGRLATPALRAWARRSEWPRQGTVRLPGLAAPVRVHHDAQAVPHIRAASDADAFRVLGALHARERFFQMDLLRRVLRGRLAETVGDRPVPGGRIPFGAGSTTADADRFLRLLDLVPAAHRVWAAAEPGNRALLQAYVEGINATLPALRTRRPLEHRLLRLPLHRWSPIDSILIAKGMALGLSFKWRTAPVFEALSQALGNHPEHLAALLPEAPGLATMPHGTWQAGAGEPTFAPLTSLPVGSNAVLLGKGRTRSGGPLVASDPHLELGLPSVWYLASIHGARYRAVGCTLPGLPGVVIGRTPHLAWGLTNGMVDDGDLWRETLRPDGRRYRVDGTWRVLGRETQAIRRRGRAPQVFTLRRTHRGPLVSDAWPHDGAPLSLRLTLHEPHRDLETFLALGRATSVAEALAASRAFGSPAQNLLVADRRGQAGYRLMGLIPRRAGEGHPAVARDGATAASDWQGFHPPEASPETVLAPEEHLVSANQPHATRGAPAYLSHLYEPDHRARRLHARVGERRDHDTRSLQAAQLDAVDPIVSWLQEHVVVPQAETVRRDRPTLAPALDRLLACDGNLVPEAKGGPLAHLFLHHLVTRTFGPRLGASALHAWRGQINLCVSALQEAFHGPDSPWAPSGVRATLVGEALHDAVGSLRALGLGVDAPWGAWHTLTLEHPLGGASGLPALFDRGPMPIRGSPFTPSSGQYRHTRPGPMVVGASYRHVVDLGDVDAARMITLGGQSGHPGSRHYDDLTARWQAGEGIPMHLEELPPDPHPLHFEP